MQSDQLLAFTLSVTTGFFAQMIDGSLGMGYGIIVSAILSLLGFPPVQVSANVHAAKFISTFASGYSHWRFGNIDRTLMVRLAIGGICGALCGTTLLTRAPGGLIRPVVAVYLSAMGMFIVFRALGKIRTRPHHDSPQRAGRQVLLGVGGGFFDALGGGGWGPMVTSSLLVSGREPRHVIGSVSISEFCVTSTVITVLAAELPVLLAQIHLIGGLILGSLIAAPLAAKLVGRVSPRLLLLAVAGIVLVLSGGTLVSILFN